MYIPYDGFPLLSHSQTDLYPLATRCSFDPSPTPKLLIERRNILSGNAISTVDVKITLPKSFSVPLFNGIYTVASFPPFRQNAKKSRQLFLCPADP